MGKKVPLILNNPGLLCRRLLIESVDFLCLKSETHDKVVANSFMDRR